MVVWNYTDVYGVIVQFINEKLPPHDYLLNCSVVAIHRTLPKVYVRFTIKNVHNNLSHQWLVILNGHTLEKLHKPVQITTTAAKDRLW